MSFTIAQFQISQANFAHFQRWVKKPRDCVINVLQVMGILDTKTADIMRIMVGDVGVTAPQLEHIFRYLAPSFQWRFFRYTNIDTIASFCNTGLEPGRVVLCGYSHQREGHCFLIGKDLDGVIVMIDPQTGVLCNLASEVCFKNIADHTEYWVLQSTLGDIRSIQHWP